MGFAVAVGGDIAAEAVALEALDFGLHGLNFAGGEEVGDGGVAVGFEMGDLLVGKRQGAAP